MKKNRKSLFKLISLAVVFTMLFSTTVSFADIAAPDAVKNVLVNTGIEVDEVIYDLVEPVVGTSYTAQVTNGSLPDGMSIVYENGKFVLKGKAPDKATEVKLTVEYYQGADAIYDQKLNIIVADQHVHYFTYLDESNNPSTDIKMHDGKVGQKYAYQIKVNTCGEDYTVFNVGDLPEGLEMNEAFCIVGVPEKAGTFSFWVSGNTTSTAPANEHNVGGRAKYTVTINDENSNPSDGKYTIEIPVTKIVEMEGDVAPPKTDISFTVDYFGTPRDTKPNVVDCKMTTGSGEGTTNGTIVIQVNSTAELGDFAEGIIITENKVNDENWECDQNSWVVYPNISEDVAAAPKVSGVECYVIGDEGKPDVSKPGSEGITITNKYTKDDGSDPDYPYTYEKGDYTLTYVSNGGTEYAVEKYPEGQNVNLVKEPTREGYAFTGWYIDKNLKTQVTSVVMDSDKKVYAGWEKGEDTVIPEYTLTYDTKGGEAIAPEKYTKDVTASLTKVPVREGYTFTGWYNDSAITNKITTIKMDSDKTVYAGWVAGEGVVPPGGKYTLTYETNGGSAIAPKTCDPDETVSLTNAPVKVAYSFTGWYSDSALTNKITSIKMDSDKTVYAGWTKTSIPSTLNGDNHFAYVIGYQDGTVKPKNNITRAEVATIFFRLLKPEIRDGNLKTDNPFKDSKVGDWYNTPVSTLAGIGVINGRSADTFAPGSNITRAEFATMCARFDTTTVIPETSRFSDTKGHWAESYIEKAATLGWITGYTDGTFKPDQNITRAEAMTLINRVTARIPENSGDLLVGMRTWSDNADTAIWYYLAVQEATTSHDFKMKNEINEKWTKITPDPDWSKYN